MVRLRALAGAHDRPETLEARFRPENLRVVVDVERRHGTRQGDPRDFRLRVDVNVRSDRRRVVDLTDGAVTKGGELADQARTKAAELVDSR